MNAEKEYLLFLLILPFIEDWYKRDFYEHIYNHLNLIE